MLNPDYGRSFSVCSLILVVLFLNSVGAFAQSGPAGTTLYLPVLQPAPGGEIGLALSNPTVLPVQVKLTAKDYSGNPIANVGITNPVTLTLPASGQAAYLASEIFGSGISGQAGSVTIESPSNSITGLFLVFDSALTYIDGAELVSSPAYSLIFPKVSTIGSPTSITFINTGAVSTNATLAFFDNSGSLVSTQQIELAAYGGFSGSIATLAPNISVSGYAALQASDAVLVGFESYRNAADNAALTAVPTSTRMTTGYIPHLATQGGYYSTLILVNPSNQPQSVQVTMVYQAGSAATSTASITRTINANGRLEERLDSMFSLSDPNLTTGYIRFDVQTATPGLIGFLEFATTDGVLLSAVRAQNVPASDFFFSHVAEGQGYYTGIGLLNPNADPAQVALDIIDRDGKRVASTVVDLAGGERRARLVSELIPGTVQLGGYIRISATRPIFAVELFGSRDSLQFLANVAPQGLPTDPQLSGSLVAAKAGAQVVSADGTISLLIPHDSLSSDALVQLRPLDLASLPASSSGQQVISAVEATPSGLQFNVPLRLAFPVGAQLPAGMQLPLLLLDDNTQQYVDSGFVATVDEIGQSAVASVTHFSKYVSTIATNRLLQISSIVPSSGVPGTTVTIVGSGFNSVASLNKVTFAGPSNVPVVATIASATPLSLQVVVPQGAVTGNVIVQSDTKTSAGIPFTVLAPPSQPAITTLTPATVDFGRTAINVQISGSGFTANSVTTFDGTSVPSTFVNSNTLFIRVSGILDPRNHQVMVTNPPPGGGSSNSATLLVLQPTRTLTGLNPSSGVQGSSVNAVVTGTSLNGATGVTFSGTGVTGTISSATGNSISISVTISSAATIGARDLTVTFAGGVTASLTGAFTVTSTNSNPTVSGISPASGAQGANLNATITGTNLLGATGVTFSGTGIFASVGTVSSTSVSISISIIAGATPGPRDVTVVKDFSGSNVSGGTTATLTGGFTVTAAPTVTALSPATGPQGATNLSATLTGTNLTGANGVTFSGSGITASVAAVTPTSISLSITITSGAATGTRDVTVVLPGGVTATLPAGFTVSAASSITTVSPAVGVQGATNLAATLTGTNLTGATGVTFSGAGVTASLGTVTATSISVSISITSGATTGLRDITVTLPGGITATLTGGFSVTASPTLTGINPTSGAQGIVNLSAILTGTNLTAATGVTFSGTGVTASLGTVTATSISISITVTSGAATGARNVTVTLPGGVTATLTGGFSVTAGIAITAINPALGSQGATNLSATLTGTNLTGATGVNFSGTGVTASLGTVTPTSISISITITGGAAVGARDVTVTLPGGATATLPGGFSVNAAPTLTAINPGAGIQGVTNLSATLTGTNLTGATGVTFSGTGVTASLGSVSATNISLSITITAGAATGARNVTVALPGGVAGTLTGGFSVSAGPTLTAINPATGVQGTTNLSATLTGTNLTGATGVTFSGSGVTASLGTVTATSISVSITVTSGAASGARNVNVMFPGGVTATLTGGFTVVAGTSITTISPAFGSQGATNVSATLGGLGLIGATGVTFSGTGVTATLGTVTASSISISITISSGAATGTRDITVTLPGGLTATLTAGFTVNAAPTLTGINPGSGAQGATSLSATLTGANLTGATGVTFSGTGVTASLGTVAATSISMSITITGGAATGARNVTVTLPGGVSATLNGVFTVSASSSDSVPPVVSMTSGNTATLIASLTATATDNVAVANVQFQVKPPTGSFANQGTAVTVPASGSTYKLSWDTKSLTNGSYQVRAIATDTSGNQTTSGTINVSINQYFASPTGSTSGTAGTFANPWDLQTALCGGNQCYGTPSGVVVVQPGATIWLRGGSYRYSRSQIPSVFGTDNGVFTSQLTGTPASPIVVRSYPGERAIVDGNISNLSQQNFSVIRVYGNDTWFMDFEITNSDANPSKRILTVPDYNDESNRVDRRGNSIDVYGIGTKLINLIVYDTGQGPGMWTQSQAMESYGNIIFNNGWDARNDEQGTVRGSSATTVTLATTMSSTFNFVGAGVNIVSGTGAGQNRTITAFNGTSKVANLDSAWTTQPDTTSKYVLCSDPVGSFTTVCNQSPSAGRLAGHGIYTENNIGLKTIQNNIIFHQFGDGLHARGSGNSQVGHYLIQNNIHFSDRFLIGGPPLQDVTVKNNSLFSSGFSVGESDSGNTGLTVTDNYFIERDSFTIGANILYFNDFQFLRNTVFADFILSVTEQVGVPTNFANFVINNNSYFRKRVNSDKVFFMRGLPVDEFNWTEWRAAFPSFDTASTYNNLTTGPTGLQISARPNTYDPGRLYVAIFNFDSLNSVTIPAANLASLGLANGDTYEVRSAVNYFGDIVTGTYNGTGITVDMRQSARTLAVPLGGTSPVELSPFPTFGAFVIFKR